MLNHEANEKWQAVIGRSLAYLCLRAAELHEAEVGDKAEFLAALGLNGADMAPLIGSTEGSVTRMLQQRRKLSKGGPRGGKAGKNARR